MKFFNTLFYIFVTIAIGYILFITIEKKEIELTKVELLQGNFESIYESKLARRTSISYDIDIQNNDEILKILPQHSKCFKFQEFKQEVKLNDKIELQIDDDENFIFNSVKSIISIKVDGKEYLNKNCINSSIQKSKTRIPIMIVVGLILLLLIKILESRLLK